MAALSATTRRIFRFREGSIGAPAIIAGAPEDLLANRPVAAERDHLLDPGRAVRVADRRLEQPRRELDALGVRVGGPGRGVVGPLRRGQLVTRRVDCRPQRCAAGGEVAAAAEARLERATQVLPQELAQILVDEIDPPARESTLRVVGRALERV